MNIYLITRISGAAYDEYDAMVVCHNSHSEALQLTIDQYSREYGGWPIESDDDVEITLIGTASDGSEPKIILASFNAG